MIKIRNPREEGYVQNYFPSIPGFWFFVLKYFFSVSYENLVIHVDYINLVDKFNFLYSSQQSGQCIDNCRKNYIFETLFVRQLLEVLNALSDALRIWKKKKYLG